MSPCRRGTVSFTAPSIPKDGVPEFDALAFIARSGGIIIIARSGDGIIMVRSGGGIMDRSSGTIMDRSSGIVMDRSGGIIIIGIESNIRHVKRLVGKQSNAHAQDDQKESAVLSLAEYVGGFDRLESLVSTMRNGNEARAA